MDHGGAGSGGGGGAGAGRALLCMIHNVPYGTVDTLLYSRAGTVTTNNCRRRGTFFLSFFLARSLSRFIFGSWRRIAVCKAKGHETHDRRLKNEQSGNSCCKPNLQFEMSAGRGRERRGAAPPGGPPRMFNVILHFLLLELGVSE